jgi:pimeloyl-ACP methyl ester carboxylesterase
LTSRDANVGEVRLRVVESGPADGPLVVLLHGFPEFWYSWRHQIPALASAGFRVLAPDLRGYGESEKPAGVRAYALDRLVADVAGLIEEAGREKAHVVGHDWGAILAWMVANDRPDRVDKLAILNVPHPRVMARALRRDPRQRRKSWYVFFFQLPYLPEQFARRDHFRMLRVLLKRDPVRKDAFSDEDVDRYIAAFSRPGAATAAINWYRAALRYNSATRARIRPIEAPVLVIWGEQDRYLESALADPPPELVPDCRVVRLPDASHWVQCDAPERVNQELLGFLGEGSQGA